ncbi:MAG: NAD(P)/FAD-dependent oxidoreductase [Planctomycetales bacterium]
MSYDAVVIGSGPNGLAAAITIARKGRSVLVLEAADTIGGGMRSAELTLPGFVHDVCSAIHPLGVASPFFKGAELEKHGLHWIHPEIPLAHPLSDGTAAIAYQSLDRTREEFGVDGDAYQRLVQPLVIHAEHLFKQVLGPLRIPHHPLLMAKFGWHGMRSANALAKSCFRQDRVQGLFAGMAAHSILPLDRSLTAAVGLMFCITAHSGGWPLPRGGSQQIAAAMQRRLKALGGEVTTGVEIKSLNDVPTSKAVFFDTSPQSLSAIAGDALPAGYRKKLDRFRYGPSVFKIDWALDGPIPWKSAACRLAGTVHVGGNFDEVAAAEQSAWSNEPAERPFVLVAQQSLHDDSRAPSGKQTGWAYCHVPRGCRFDMTERIEAQLERFAPGFRDLILKRHVMAPRDFQHYNANYVGGDITGGVMDLRQLFARPVLRLSPYCTPAKNLFLCSASTPPGAGVHGMCGMHAAQAALRGILRE